MKKYTLAMLIVIIGATIAALAPARAQAQAPSQPRLTTAQLKPFEGYYRSSQNKDMVVDILIKDDTLVARPLWSDRIFHLVPRTDTAFVTAESVERGPIDIVFSRNSTGEIAALDLGGDKWNREKDYKPVVKKVMDHTPEQLEPYEGVYRLNRPGETLIQLYVKDNNLILRQVWDGTELPFHPENTENFFTDKIPMFSLKFTKDQQGDITQVLAFGRDVWIKTKKPGFTAADLQAASGKFQSKDDPDNQVSITAKGKQLVVKQLWDNKEIALDALTDTYFLNPSEHYRLQLSKDDDGKINHVVQLENSVFDRVPQ